jgi:ABC-type nitrate/sulfonate/bicarbonate transport system substrate-binding protein
MGAVRKIVLAPLLAFCLAHALTGSSFGADKSLKPLAVRIGIVSKSVLDLPFWVARERGFFRDEGLEAEIVLMRSNRWIK